MPDGGHMFDATGTNGCVRAGPQFHIIPESRQGVPPRFHTFRKSGVFAAIGEKGRPVPFDMEKSYLKCILCTIRFRAPARAREDGRDRVNRHRDAPRRCSGGAEGGYRWWEDVRTEEGSRF